MTGMDVCVSSKLRSRRTHGGPFFLFQNYRLSVAESKRSLNTDNELLVARINYRSNK